jgi:hypothetical protein
MHRRPAGVQATGVPSAAATISLADVAMPLAHSMKTCAAFHTRCKAAAVPYPVKMRSPGASDAPERASTCGSMRLSRHIRAASSTPHRRIERRARNWKPPGLLPMPSDAVVRSPQ